MDSCCRGHERSGRAKGNADKGQRVVEAILTCEGLADEDNIMGMTVATQWQDSPYDGSRKGSH